MLSQSKFAVLENDNPSKMPVLSAGDLTAQVVRKYETVCLRYFDNKEIEDDKQVHKILAGLRDNHIQDWIAINCNCFLKLSFINFMQELRATYLPEDWEEITHIELLAMTQGNDSFWDFSVMVQSKNSLLRDTPSYLKEEQIRHCIEAGMQQRLALHCHLEKSNLVKVFRDWLMEVKCVDDLLRSERADFEALAKSTCKANRCNNMLTEPSCCANTSNYQLAGPPGSLYCLGCSTPNASYSMITQVASNVKRFLSHTTPPIVQMVFLTQLRTRPSCRCLWISLKST